MEVAMSLRNYSLSAIVCLGLAVLAPAHASAEDWIARSTKVVGDGSINFEYPKSWGKKPEVKTGQSATNIRFGPYGPRRKPTFQVEIESVTTMEPATEADVRTIAEGEVANYKPSAAETDIPLNDIAGPKVSGHYFSITDRESKIGEFDYLTLAILRSDHLLIKCYFFSSDGAPDFGADAMQMMQSITYTPPEISERDKKKAAKEAEPDS
jgi:hypothetical protein